MEGRTRDFDELDVSGAAAGRIPVFCFPSSLIFCGTDRDQLKQILTIYNPYDFRIKFRVLSTTPDYYTVISPEGSIQSKNCVDLIIRLTTEVPFSSPAPLDSKFRVQVFHYSSKQALGRKDVPSTIIYGQSLPSGTDAAEVDAFQHLHGDMAPFSASAMAKSRRGQTHQTPLTQPTHQNQDTYAQNNVNINYVAIVTGIVCIIGLLLPLDKDDTGTSLIPSYLHLSLNQKLLVAYTLGLVTMALFRP